MRRSTRFSRSENRIFKSRRRGYVGLVRLDGNRINRIELVRLHRKTYHLIILGRAVLVLTNVLSDDDRYIRTQTVSILSQMGPEATTRTMTKK